MSSTIDRLRDYVRSVLESPEREYDVDEYVLERREPDPAPRVRSYGEPVSAEDVASTEELPSGVYLLQEIKASGMAGEIVWEKELTFDEQ